MAIDTLNKVIAGFAAGQKLDFFKATQTTEGAGTWHSLWKAAGVPPAGANPGSLAGAIPTKATTGAFSFTNPSSPALSYLLQMLSSGSITGKLIIYDRLWHNSTMSGTQTTTDTTLGAVPALTRPDANGTGTELWGEIYTPIGASGTTLNVRYTNQSGTTLQVGTYAHPANAESTGQMFRMSLAAGDTGVRAATAYHWSGTTGTAGDFGLVILRRLAEIPIAQVNIGALLDFAALGMPRIYDDACLSFMVLCTTTTSGDFQGSINIGQG